MTTSQRIVVLYTTSGCHLCEQAQALLDHELSDDREPWQLVLKDIADDPQLVERYGLRIPVVQRQDDGSELGWPFTAEQLSSLLD